MLNFYQTLSEQIKKTIEQYAPDFKFSSTVEDSPSNGVNCDPIHHQVLYADPVLRILNVTVDAHEDEIFHTHERFSIMYVDRPSRFIYYNAPDEMAWSSSDLNPRFAVIPNEGMHKIKNIDSRMFCAFRVELPEGINAHLSFDKISECILNIVKSYQSNFNEVREILLSEKKMASSLDNVLSAPPTLNWQYNNTQKSFGKNLAALNNEIMEYHDLVARL